MLPGTITSEIFLMHVGEKVLNRCDITAVLCQYKKTNRDNVLWQCCVEGVSTKPGNSDISLGLANKLGIGLRLGLKLRIMG